MEREREMLFFLYCISLYYIMASYHTPRPQRDFDLALEGFRVGTSGSLSYSIYIYTHVYLPIYI